MRKPVRENPKSIAGIMQNFKTLFYFLHDTFVIKEFLSINYDKYDRKMEAFMSGHLFDKGMLSQTGAK
jgi:hypothetical protein